MPKKWDWKVPPQFCLGCFKPLYGGDKVYVHLHFPGVWCDTCGSPIKEESIIELEDHCEACDWCQKYYISEVVDFPKRKKKDGKAGTNNKVREDIGDVS